MKTRIIKCKCGYKWITKSNKGFVTCPNCQKKAKKEVKV